ncbi:MAG: hypothetical protein IID53_15585 [Proteobacteria bacterium]|nr:hypothetical protein [Pseudomonadota bacterium]
MTLASLLRGALNGDADVLTVHDKASEPKFTADGHGGDLARRQCAELRCTPATTWGLATTPDSLIKGEPLRSG